jgi:hypothetical protein
MKVPRVEIFVGKRDEPSEIESERRLLLDP